MISTGETTALRYFEDFRVGQSFDCGAVTVTREEIVAFAERFDPQPFHLDDEAGKASLFGELSASGWHTAALCMRQLVDTVVLDSSSLGSPGVDSLRWLRPVLVNDRLSVRLQITSLRRSEKRPDLGLVGTRLEARNQRDEPVLTWESTAFFGCRPAAVPASDPGRR